LKLSSLTSASNQPVKITLALDDAIPTPACVNGPSKLPASALEEVSAIAHASVRCLPFIRSAIHRRDTEIAMESMMRLRGGAHGHLHPF
jgi:hypothetical protein